MIITVQRRYERSNIKHGSRKQAGNYHPKTPDPDAARSQSEIKRIISEDKNDYQDRANSKIQ